MTTHEHLSIEILADYAEGLLGDADSTSAAEHLASCADCQAEAELLASVSQILATDDPGPMPAHYAARIDAALAELAVAEPVTPKRRESTPVGEGAAVIDLASRRRFTPAARVTSVAASLVLLIGGVAIGMQAINTGDSNDPGIGALSDLTPSNEPTNSPRYLSYALSAQDKPTGKNAKKGKNGSIIDKRDGKVILKSGKVVFPDGVVVVPKDDGAAEVRTVDVATGRSKPVQTFSAREIKSRPSSTPAETPVVTPSPTPEPTKQAPTPTSVPVGDPWVSNTGSTYTEDNFAAKAQDLLQRAGETSTVASSNESGNNAPSSTQQNRVTSASVRSDETASTKGPAPTEVAAKVKRCATQLQLGPVVAADAGIWKGQAATVLLVRDAGADKASGYVVYGDCTKDAPATKASIQWTQAVAIPAAAEPTPDPTPTTNPEVNPSSSSGTSSNSPSTSINTSVPATVTPSLEQ